MSDYQLERLNTRSFEQLVQALALEVLGRQVVVFGDGPDGGREASFRGPVDYPRRARGWNGYGVVQAKFRQQPSEMARKNADWALGELKSEFKKFLPKPKRQAKGAATSAERICPDFYVFATNLALSPVLKSGGKDRVISFLDACKQSHGLLDYAVWDRDQIRSMLEAQTAIRTSFLPFILPGDVLAQVMRDLRPKQADFAKTMLRHLQLELLDDQYAKLSQGGYTNANRIYLSTVFVDLPSDGIAGREEPSSPDGTPAPRATFLKGLFAEASCVLRPTYQRAAAKNTDVHQRAPVAGRYVVIGGPGQGKTTVGVFACQMMRAALLREAAGHYDRDVQQALDDILAQAAALPPLTALRYPLRVDLKHLAEALAAPAHVRSHSLLDFLTRHIAKRTGTQLNVEDFRLWLRSYPWLLVLDGLDEVPASSNRTLMMNAINDFIRIEAHQEDADLMVVATTRPQGYSDEFDPSNYAHLHLLPLQPDEALHYGTRLAEARHPGAASRVESLVRTLALATRNPATSRLMESPLQVTIMLSLIELGGHPPEQRWQLFNQYYETIFKREKERDTPFSRVLRDYEADIHWIHHRAGWMLQQRNAESGKTAARLSHEEFDNLVHKRLIRRGHADDGDLAQLVEQMREAATDRLVLLVGNTADEIGFEIRSLQEFMAAEHAFDGDDEGVRNTLQLIAPHAYWRNVFLFMAGRIFFSKEPLVDSLVALCDHLNEPLADAALAQTTAGSRLALALLADDACRKQPANSRRLARLAARLMDRPLLDDERVALSGQFTREAAAVLRQELTDRLDDAQFSPGAWAACLDLTRHDVDWAKERVRQTFPWRHPKLGDFLRDYISFGADVGNFFWSEIGLNLRFLGLSVVEKLVYSDKLQNFIDPSIAAAIEVLFRGSTDHFLLLAQDGSELNDVMRHGCGNLAPYLQLRMEGQDFSDAHPDWKCMSAAAAFAGEPTLDNLCGELRQVFSIDPAVPNRSHYALPWQFNVCLVAAGAGMSVASVLEAIRAGRLGTPSDWSRWADIRQLPIRDLRQSSDLISVSDGQLGRAFGWAGWSLSRTGTRETFRFLDELRKVLPDLDPAHNVTLSLMQVAGYGLTSEGGHWSESALAEIRAFIQTAVDTGHRVGQDFTVAILLSDLSVDNQLDLLQTIKSRAPVESWYWSVHGSRSKIWEAWFVVYHAAIAAGRELEVLPALGQMPPMASMTAVPSEVLQRALTGGETLRHAAELIKLSALRWNASEAEAVAARLLSLMESEPRWFWNWMEYVDYSAPHGGALELVLLALQKAADLARKDWFQFRGVSLLSKVVDHRPAPTVLPDPSLIRTQASPRRH